MRERPARGARLSPIQLLLAVVLVGLCVFALIWNIVLTKTMTDQLHMDDFGKFYSSARAFLDGGDMYAATTAADPNFEKARDLRLLNMNPPHFHVLVLPLAMLPPATALALWMAVSIAALVLSVLLVSQELAVAWTPLRALATTFAVLWFAGTQAFFDTGQLSMLLLFAITICWIDARHGRWTRSAVWLGVCLSVKPFLLIFIPYLVGTRRYRAAAIVLATAAGCFAAGVLLFGVHSYVAWYGALSQAGDWAWAGMNASLFSFFRRAFGESPYFASLTVSPRLVNSWLVAAGVVGLVTVAAVVTDTTSAAVDRAFSLLLVAAQLISPLGWVYYLSLPAGPVVAIFMSSRFMNSRGARHSMRWFDGVLVIALVGFAWPLAWPYIMQPHAWATLTIGSFYFWATICLWKWLLMDYFDARKSYTLWRALPLTKTSVGATG